MGELQALDQDLPEPARILAQELRTLFEGLGVSLNRYAARMHRDAGAVSRFLGGRRVPPWAFVYDLLVESTERQGAVPPTQSVVTHLRRLHHDALRTGGSPGHQVQLLQDQLAEADRDASRAASRERELETALQTAQHHIAQLLVREREIEAIREEERDGHGVELALYRDELGKLREAHAVLCAEIERLEHELFLAQQRSIAAEGRCGAGASTRSRDRNLSGYGF